MVVARKFFAVENCLIASSIPPFSIANFKITVRRESSTFPRAFPRTPFWQLDPTKPSYANHKDYTIPKIVAWTSEHGFSIK